MVLKLTIVSILLVLFIYNGIFIVEDINILALVLLIIVVINTCIFLYKYRRNNIISFELLFFIAFLLSSFQYPLFGNEFESYTSNKFFSISNKLYTNGISIAVLGYLFYLLGAILVSKSIGTGKIVYNFSQFNVKRLRIPFHYLTLFTFFVTLSLGGYRLLFQYSLQNSDRWAGVGSLWDFLWIFFIISSILEFMAMGERGVKSVKTFLLNSSNLYLSSVVLNLSFLLIAGYRSDLLFIALPILLLYSNFIKKVKIIPLLILISIGSLIFLVSGEARELTGGLLNTENISKARSTINENSFLLRDFTPANGALFKLVDYADKQGITWGSNILFQVLATIPFSQAIAVNVFDISPGIYSSILYTTELNGSNYSSGLGTHIIGDLYYTFGLGGVIIFMYFLGWVVAYLYNKIVIEKRSNIYMLIALCILFGNSIYSVRVEYFFIFRTLSFTMIVFWVIGFLFLDKKKQTD